MYNLKLLYDHAGLTDDLFRVSLVYVACSGCPMHELLGTDRPSQADLHTQEFVGTTRESARLEALEEARERLLSDLRDRLSDNVAAFLLSLHDAQPDFDLIGPA